MKLYKKIDLALQLLLVATALVLWALDGSEGLIIGYLLVGGSQILSLIIHALLPAAYYPAKRRSAYAYTVLGIGFIGIFSFAFLILYMAALLVIAPFLACWYCIICNTEIRLLEEKSLIHLKR